MGGFYMGSAHIGGLLCSISISTQRIEPVDSIGALLKQSTCLYVHRYYAQTVSPPWTAPIETFGHWVGGGTLAPKKDVGAQFVCIG